MVPRRVYLILGTVLVLAGGAACQPGGPQSSAPPADLPATDSTALEPLPESEVAPTEAEGLAESEAPPQTLVPDAAAPEPTATVDVSPNLRATDPSTVSLAAGQPQLVEFFAFW